MTLPASWLATTGRNLFFDLNRGDTARYQLGNAFRQVAQGGKGRLGDMSLQIDKQGLHFLGGQLHQIGSGIAGRIVDRIQHAVLGINPNPGTP